MAEDGAEGQVNDSDIAIVGMAAHLPGARSIAEFWDNLVSGIESVETLDDATLLKNGETPANLQKPNYVRSAALLKDFETFDGEFFGFSPKESAIMDPQHRQFLETAWEALENAGHMPEHASEPIGVFAGCGMGSYFYFNICSNPGMVDDVGMFLLRHTGNDKDFMATRLSHILDLKGPSINVQTACSTSLVATHYACQALLSGECGMALAGGVTIEMPQGRGYLYKEGEVLSPDGHCHPFDHRAQGTVFGSGAGVVVLRRLADAVADGDMIYAVIKGSAVNNDGADKAGYLAPSVSGQADAIADAHAMAGVSADTIDYVECHGTGTYLGDPIEIAALTSAFRETTDATGYCHVGSVKSNIGHLDTAAGVAGLIKTSLALHNRQIPPTLGFEAPNPSIDFETSPFKVGDRLLPFESHAGPRRAGVNSLGVGGTNAHVVLEEAPTRPASEEADFPFHILSVSARSKAALDDNAARLADHLRNDTSQPLADIAWTLKTGRRAFEKHRVIVAENHEEAARLLTENDPRRVFNHSPVGDAPELVFMFPGGGSQYARMAVDLYETEPVFADWMDQGLAILHAKSGLDYRPIWLAEGKSPRDAVAQLETPSVQLPLILIVEVALAELLKSWGVEPNCLIGHSMGENTAACLAGVMSFEDAIGLVLLRGQLFDTVPAGGMLSVSLSEAEIQPFLGDGVDIAGLNAPHLTVVSGSQAALDELAARLDRDEVSHQRIPINIAAHSAMLDPILDEFRGYLQSIQLNPPAVPIVSNRSGFFITPAEATDPDYWVGHLRNAVRFADGIATLSENPERIYLEVGPGKALSSLVGMHGSVAAQAALGSLRHPDDPIADDKAFMEVLGRLDALGAPVDWPQIWGDARRNRVVLPSYAFQRQPYFITPGKPAADGAALPMKQPDPADWYWETHWKPVYADISFDVTEELARAEPMRWLFFLDEVGLGQCIAERLITAGYEVICVRAGDAFGRGPDGSYTLAPEQGFTGFGQLFADLSGRDQAPQRIVNFWPVTEEETFRPGSSFFNRAIEQGYWTALFTAQALAAEAMEMPVHFQTVTTGAAAVGEEILTYPERRMMGPALKVLSREFPGLTAGTLDIVLPGSGRRGLFRRATAAGLEGLIPPILEELLSQPTTRIAALRGARRYEQAERPAPLAAIPAVAKKGGTVLITGGFGGMGQTLAEVLIEQRGMNVALLSRQQLPDEAEWDRFLEVEGPFNPVARQITALRALRADGGRVIAVTGDVCNPMDMQRVKSEVEAAFGPITGVVHTAGVMDDAPLMAKTSADIDAVLAPKVLGTRILDDLFDDGALDWMVLCASTSALIGAAGQADYAAANGFLSAYAQSRKGDKTKVVAINWGIWNGVGMAARALGSEAISGLPQHPTTQPVLRHIGFDGDGNRMLTGSLSARDWLLDEHRMTNGAAVLPGTGYLELAAEAMAAIGETEPFDISDLYFLRPLLVADREAIDIRVHLIRVEDGYRMELRSPVTLAGRKAFQLHAEATLTARSDSITPPMDQAAIAARCQNVTEAAQGARLASAQEGNLKFGPRWAVLKRTALGAAEGVAHLSLAPEFRSDLDDGHRLHSALLDIATGWAMQLIPRYRADRLWVPISYQRVSVFQPLGAEIVSHVRLNAGASDPDQAVFDVTLADPGGKVLVEIAGFRIQRLQAGQTVTASTPPTAAEVVFDTNDRDAVRSPDEERLRHSLSQGLQPAEGAAAFLAALADGRSEIVVSSIALPALIAQADRPEPVPTADGQKFERPTLESTYIAPRNAIEETLAGFWRELLGVDDIGVEDSFFDLGGHSLIAMRLFLKIKKEYQLDFPISVLFEAPTIAECAALIEARVGPTDTTDPEETAPEGSDPQFRHLVALHQGSRGAGRPFFLIAGMFGNVLNLRHLALLLGGDRPFYGVQARGLLGGEAPHATLQEAARDYISEMRHVQPHGPYLLGGFSGGGITAYEVARQLEAAGETVLSLVLLDTPLPVRRPLAAKDRALIQLAEIRKGGPAYPFRWALNRIRWEFEKRAKTVAPETGENAFHNREIEAAFLNAVANYQMERWDGPVTLFRPPLIGTWQVSEGKLVNSERAYLLPDNDWGQYVPDITVEEVPGDHDSMVLEPNVRVLASKIRALIVEAEAGWTHQHGIAPFVEAAE